jgi:intein-encoded DNA endonuclease-like protein
MIEEHKRRESGSYLAVPLNEAISLYKTGMTIREIGKRLNYHETLVQYRLRKAGIKLKRKRYRIPINQTVLLYELGISTDKIAEIYKTTFHCIRDCLVDHGVEIRHIETHDFSLTDAEIPYETYLSKNTESAWSKINNSWISINDSFFANWSHELAYILGWIVSDGNIPQTKKCFRITSTDIDHLQEMANLFSVGITMSIRKWPENKKHYKPAGTISVFRSDIVEWLISIGIIPNKSNIIKMPQIPQEYLRDFVRGVFGGDGCFTFKHSKYGLSPKLVFTSGSLDFVTELGEQIQKQTGLKYQVESQNTIHNLTYYNNTAIETIFSYMYEGVPENLILKRKYEKFKQYFSGIGGDPIVSAHDGKGRLQPSKVAQEMSEL